MNLNQILGFHGTYQTKDICLEEPFTTQQRTGKQVFKKGMLSKKAFCLDLSV